jgi:nucleotide-binding universal stress UspA family protein
MKTLLILIREPESSRSLVEYATELAKDLQTNLFFIYVENPVTYPLGTPGMSSAAVAQAQKLLEERVKAGRKILNEQVSVLKPSVPAELMVEVGAESGPETRIIREQIDAGKAHMVLVEEPEFSGFWLRDTSAKSMVKELDCPVWVIPKNAKYHALDEIIYASDYHEEDVEAINKLVEMTNPLTPNITSVHIAEKADFDLRIKNAGFQKILESSVGYSKIKVKALVENNGEETAELLNSYADRIGADLLVVLKENRGFPERIFKASSSEKIIEASRLPVLVFHAN